MAEVYDPRGHTWDSWSALMAERFSANPLGTAPETQWVDWANGLAGIGRFDGVPDSRGFATWQDWAFALNNTLRR